MRDFKRLTPLRQPHPHMKLSRGQDGRLRSAGGEAEIGDVWAEQKRIRLAEAIREDQKKAEKQKRPKWRPFARKATKPTTTSIQSSTAPKEIVVNLGIPMLRTPKWVTGVREKVSKRQTILGASIALAVLTLSVGGYMLLPSVLDSSKKSSGLRAEVLDIKSEQPGYQTVLPVGKNIDDLGGWARVSPPDKDPVFAYVDTIDGVQVNVSQQPLPDALKRNTDGELLKLAEQFNAKEKLTLGGVTAYIGTSIKGPQSVIFAKGDLLILARSSAKLTNEQWQSYISSLE